MKRRAFLQLGGMALFVAAGGVSASANPLLPPPAVSGGKDTLVVVFLRGGLDGMHALVPYASPEYYQARPNLAVPQPTGREGSLELDGQFALHPALKPLHELYQANELAAVCAIGTSDRSRSHFLAQDFLEYAGGEKGQGWLNRYLGDNDTALSTKAHLPGLLKGPHPVLDAATIEDLLAYAAPPADYSGAGEVARLSRQEKLFQKRLSALRPPSGNHYPASSLGQQLRTVAFLLKQGVELKAAHCEVSGFDTHSRQIDGLWPGNLMGLNRLLFDTAEAIAAFWKDLGERAGGVTLLTLTEFGRRLHENASLGTDHGLASASFVLGSRVRGGKVYGRWPGLQPEALVDGIDLQVTTDYRQLINEYTQAAGGEPLFSNFQGTELGLFRDAYGSS